MAEMSQAVARFIATLKAGFREAKGDYPSRRQAIFDEAVRKHPRVSQSAKHHIARELGVGYNSPPPAISDAKLVKLMERMGRLEAELAQNQYRSSAAKFRDIAQYERLQSILDRARARGNGRHNPSMDAGMTEWSARIKRGGVSSVKKAQQLSPMQKATLVAMLEYMAEDEHSLPEFLEGAASPSGMYGSRSEVKANVQAIMELLSPQYARYIDFGG